MSLRRFVSRKAAAIAKRESHTTDMKIIKLLVAVQDRTRQPTLTGPTGRRLPFKADGVYPRKRLRFAGEQMIGLLLRGVKPDYPAPC